MFNGTSGEDVKPAVIHLTHGHAKDKRPDQKQAVLSPVVNGPSQMPIWMDALDGNSSDKKSFQETIRKVRGFQKQVNLEADFKWVAETIAEAKDEEGHRAPGEQDAPFFRIQTHFRLQIVNG